MHDSNPLGTTIPDEDFAYDVDLENFEARVIQPSFQVPVLIDFWAPWCAPCQALKPVLEKLAREYAGRFLLARVNSDEYPQIAQHFGIRSIPSVKVMQGGRLVDEFTGAQPESEIRAFIDRLLPPPAADEREQAKQLAAEGRHEEALSLLVQALQANPESESLRLDTVETLLALGRLNDAQTLLAGEFEQESGRAHALRSRLDLLDHASDPDQIAQLEARLALDPDDHPSRLELSAALAAAGEYRRAMEAALDVVRRNRDFDEGAGRKALLKLFEALGGSEQHDDLIREYRRHLSALLN